MTRAILVFRSTCTKCRILSRIAVWLGFGAVRRLAHDSEESVNEKLWVFRRGKLKLVLVVGTFRLTGVMAAMGVPFASALVVAVSLKDWFRRHLKEN